MAFPSIKTDFLVVGAGPAGASLACFLGQNGELFHIFLAFSNTGLTGTTGLKGIVISNAACSADTPRAHLINPFALGGHPPLTFGSHTT